MLKVVYPGTFDPFTRGPRGPRRVARPGCSTASIVGVADSRVQAAVLHRRGAGGDGAGGAVADLPNVEVVRFSVAADGFRPRAGRAGDPARLARGVGFRVRVPDGRDEPQPLSRRSKRCSSRRREQYMFVSATIVREIARFGGDVSQFVHPIGLRAAQGARRRGSAGGPADALGDDDGADDHRRMHQLRRLRAGVPERARSRRATRSTSSTPTSAPSASATSTRRSASRSARSTAFPSTRTASSRRTRCSGSTTALMANRTPPRRRPDRAQARQPFAARGRSRRRRSTIAIAASSRSSAAMSAATDSSCCSSSPTRASSSPLARWMR